MKNFKVLIIAIIMFNSCKNNVIKNNYFDKICISKKGFQVDTTKASWTYSTVLNDTYLNIRPLDIPSDTFFFRIQANLDTTLQIFEFSFNNAQSTFKLYKFKVDAKSGRILFDKEHDDIKNYETIFDQSKKGKDFIAQLEKNNILELRG